MNSRTKVETMCILCCCTYVSIHSSFLFGSLLQTYGLIFFLKKLKKERRGNLRRRPAGGARARHWSMDQSYRLVVFPVHLPDKQYPQLPLQEGTTRSLTMRMVNLPRCRLHPQPRLTQPKVVAQDRQPAIIDFTAFPFVR